MSPRISSPSIVLLSVLAVLASLALLASAAVLHPPTAERVYLAFSGTETVELRTLPDADGTAPGVDGTARTAELLQEHLDRLDSGWTRVTPGGEETIEVEVRAGGGTDEIAEFLRHFEAHNTLSVRPVVGVREEPSVNGLPGNLSDEPEELPGSSADSPSPALSETELSLFDETGTLLHLGPAAMSGNDVEGAEAQRSGDRWTVTVHFRHTAREAWRELTGDAACFETGDPRRRIAIVMGGRRLVSAPEVGPGLTCDTGLGDTSTTISSPSFGQKSAANLTLEVLGATLPFPFEVVSTGPAD